MSTNAFLNRPAAPSEAEVAQALGSARARWDAVVALLADEFGVRGQEWKSYSVKAGWSLRLLDKKRVIVYMVPMQAGFEVSLALGGKAIEAARAAGLPSRVEKLIDAAPRYAEGTGVRFAVEKAADLDVIRHLVRIKLAK